MDAESARIFEVGPRDGLQNEEARLSVDQKVEMIERLVAAGVKDVEIGSFVHPKWVPQMADTDRVAERLSPQDGVRYWALVPNQTGLERAIQVEVEHVATFMSASESHNQKNLNRSIDESLAELRATLEMARRHDCEIRAYISTAFGCPYEGRVDFERVLDIGDELLEAGAGLLSLGDTIGAGTPPQIEESCRRAVESFGADRVALHLHDTQGLALTNAYVAWQVGVRQFDSAVGGTGGCPYAPGAAGNVASEDLAHLFETMDVDTGLSLPDLLETSSWIADTTDIDISSRYWHYWMADR
ncbi:MAG: hydroxymethylglutaryl-CoA lyase [Persicimonas sp.]